jgi:uncharacterized SAM-binding protein YcdF (DUF218 family)
MSPRRFLLLGLLFIAIVTAICWATHPRLLHAAASWLDVGEKPQKAHYAMVLGGGEDTRPFIVAALIEDGWAKHALVAKFAPTPSVTDGIIPPFEQINREAFLRRGVPSSDVTVLPGAAATTYDEANALKAFLQDRPAARVLVVTNDYHTRRSRWVFARVLGDRARNITFVSAPTDEFPMDCWWRSQLGFLAITTEYLKLAFYAVAYGSVGYWLAACALLALVAVWIRRRERANYRNRLASVGDGSTCVADVG